ncbi:MAG: tRNA (adenosine(37)-N6)-threonylcarbamoyltransferase complex transferase subunit TsaD [Chitinophagales bacterium]|jgi:N6-L-threonylcarbamoyladenine synthase|nr:tRNA (adenosine(37)-N6)-threonylcarbamoyltransferase complex transferase subunit TsaD [Chitinophagales bacterium]
MKILSIETSCDDTSIAILQEDQVLSSIVYSQKVHEAYRGVVPELASRDHEAKIIEVLEMALDASNTQINEITNIAVTQGPGLIGSLMVGVNFAKGLALSLDLPIIPVNHIHGHILSPFIGIPKEVIEFPHISFVVSGGHTFLFLLRNFLEYEILGHTIDDAAGEAFDKSAKMLGLGYPGGPIIDKLAQDGNPESFTFSKPNLEGYNFSFSGLKTSILYRVQKEIKQDENFIEKHKNDLAASIQLSIVDMLMKKLNQAIATHKPSQISIAGGVAANSGFRKACESLEATKKIKLFLPKLQYCTDNAAMIGFSAYHQIRDNEIFDQKFQPFAKFSVK